MNSLIDGSGRWVNGRRRARSAIAASDARGSDRWGALPTPASPHHYRPVGNLSRPDGGVGEPREAGSDMPRRARDAETAWRYLTPVTATHTTRSTLVSGIGRHACSAPSDRDIQVVHRPRRAAGPLSGRVTPGLARSIQGHRRPLTKPAPTAQLHGNPRTTSSSQYAGTTRLIFPSHSTPHTRDKPSMRLTAAARGSVKPRRSINSLRQTWSGTQGARRSVRAQPRLRTRAGPHLWLSCSGSGRSVTTRAVSGACGNARSSGHRTRHSPRSPRSSPAWPPGINQRGMAMGLQENEVGGYPTP